MVNFGGVSVSGLKKCSRMVSVIYSCSYLFRCRSSSAEAAVPESAKAIVRGG